MIRWCEDLYMDEKVGRNPEKWKRRVEDGKLSLHLACIAIASNEENLFDIMDCNEMWFRYYREREMRIVGLAADKESAILLLQDIVEDACRKTGKPPSRDSFEFGEARPVRQKPA